MSVFLTLAFLFSFASCEDEPEDTPPPITDDTQKPTPPSPLNIITSGGECRYVIVYDYECEDAMNAAYLLRTKIKQTLSVSIVTTPSNLYASEGNEIIIGVSSMMPSDAVSIIRGAEDYPYYYYYGTDGTDLALYASGYDAYADMIENLCSSFIISNTFTIPGNYSKLIRLTEQEYSDKAPG